MLWRRRALVWALQHGAHHSAAGCSLGRATTAQQGCALGRWQPQHSTLAPSQEAHQAGTDAACTSTNDVVPEHPPDSSINATLRESLGDGGITAASQPPSRRASVASSQLGTLSARPQPSEGENLLDMKVSGHLRRRDSPALAMPTGSTLSSALGRGQGHGAGPGGVDPSAAAGRSTLSGEASQRPGGLAGVARAAARGQPASGEDILDLQSGRTSVRRKGSPLAKALKSETAKSGTLEGLSNAKLPRSAAGASTQPGQGTPPPVHLDTEQDQQGPHSTLSSEGPSVSTLGRTDALHLEGDATPAVRRPAGGNLTAGGGAEPAQGTKGGRPSSGGASAATKAEVGGKGAARQMQKEIEEQMLTRMNESVNKSLVEAATGVLALARKGTRVSEDTWRQVAQRLSYNNCAVVTWSSQTFRHGLDDEASADHGVPGPQSRLGRSHQVPVSASARAVMNLEGSAAAGPKDIVTSDSAAALVLLTEVPMNFFQLSPEPGPAQLAEPTPGASPGAALGDVDRPFKPAWDTALLRALADTAARDLTCVTPQQAVKLAYILAKSGCAARWHMDAVASRLLSTPDTPAPSALAEQPAAGAAPPGAPHPSPNLSPDTGSLTTHPDGRTKPTLPGPAAATAAMSQPNAGHPHAAEAAGTAVGLAPGAASAPAQPTLLDQLGYKEWMMLLSSCVSLGYRNPHLLGGMVDALERRTLEASLKIRQPKQVPSLLLDIASKYVQLNHQSPRLASALETAALSQQNAWGAKGASYVVALTAALVKLGGAGAGMLAAALRLGAEHTVRLSKEELMDGMAVATYAFGRRRASAEAAVGRSSPPGQGADVAEDGQGPGSPPALRERPQPGSTSAAAESAAKEFVSRAAVQLRYDVAALTLSEAAALARACATVGYRDAKLLDALTREVALQLEGAAGGGDGTPQLPANAAVLTEIAANVAQLVEAYSALDFPCTRLQRAAALMLLSPVPPPPPTAIPASQTIERMLAAPNHSMLSQGQRDSSATLSFAARPSMSMQDVAWTSGSQPEPVAGAGAGRKTLLLHCLAPRQLATLASTFAASQPVSKLMALNGAKPTAVFDGTEPTAAQAVPQPTSSAPESSPQADQQAATTRLVSAGPVEGAASTSLPAEGQGAASTSLPADGQGVCSQEGEPWRRDLLVAVADRLEQELAGRMGGPLLADHTRVTPPPRDPLWQLLHQGQQGQQAQQGWGAQQGQQGQQGQQAQPGWGGQQGRRTLTLGDGDAGPQQGSLAEHQRWTAHCVALPPPWGTYASRERVDIRLKHVLSVAEALAAHGVYHPALMGHFVSSAQKLAAEGQLRAGSWAALMAVTTRMEVAGGARQSDGGDGGRAAHLGTDALAELAPAVLQGNGGAPLPAPLLVQLLRTCLQHEASASATRNLPPPPGPQWHSLTRQNLEPKSGDAPVGCATDGTKPLDAMGGAGAEAGEAGAEAGAPKATGRYAWRAAAATAALQSLTAGGRNAPAPSDAVSLLQALAQAHGAWGGMQPEPGPGQGRGARGASRVDEQRGSAATQSDAHGSAPEGRVDVDAEDEWRRLGALNAQVADAAAALLVRPDNLRRLAEGEWEAAVTSLAALGHCRPSTYNVMAVEAPGADLPRGSWQVDRLLALLQVYADAQCAPSGFMGRVARCLALHSPSLSPPQLLHATSLLVHLALTNTPGDPSGTSSETGSPISSPVSNPKSSFVCAAAARRARAQWLGQPLKALLVRAHGDAGRYATSELLSLVRLALQVGHHPNVLSRTAAHRLLQEQRQAPSNASTSPAPTLGDLHTLITGLAVSYATRLAPLGGSANMGKAQQGVQHLNAGLCQLVMTALAQEQQGYEKGSAGEPGEWESRRARALLRADLFAAVSALAAPRLAAAAIPRILGSGSTTDQPQPPGTAAAAPASSEALADAMDSTLAAPGAALLYLAHDLAVMLPQLSVGERLQVAEAAVALGPAAPLRLTDALMRDALGLVGAGAGGDQRSGAERRALGQAWKEGEVVAVTSGGQGAGDPRGAALGLAEADDSGSSSDGEDDGWVERQGSDGRSGAPSRALLGTGGGASSHQRYVGAAAAAYVAAGGRQAELLAAFAEHTSSRSQAFEDSVLTPGGREGRAGGSRLPDVDRRVAAGPPMTSVELVHLLQACAQLLPELLAGVTLTPKITGAMAGAEAAPGAGAGAGAVAGTGAGVSGAAQAQSVGQGADVLRKSDGEAAPPAAAARGGAELDMVMSLMHSVERLAHSAPGLKGVLASCKDPERLQVAVASFLLARDTLDKFLVASRQGAGVHAALSPVAAGSDGVESSSESESQQLDMKGSHGLSTTATSTAAQGRGASEHEAVDGVDAAGLLRQAAHASTECDRAAKAASARLAGVLKRESQRK